MVAVVTVLARAARWDPGDAAGRARDLWVAAWMASARYPAGGIRVSQADPRRLGVHAAISVPGVPDEIPPEYVPRDADDGESGVRAKVAAASERGGFVLLVGGSSVGKTRCAFEAVTALLSDWWLVHPARPGEIAAPTPRTVVWLDELQRYLDGEHGLSGGVIRVLLNAPDPVVIIGTLWPEFYTTLTTLPVPGGPDPHAREREVLKLTDVVRIGPAFTPAEQGRARAAAARDLRLEIAMEAAGYGLTQTLAAAPQLVARWEDAQAADPYAWAVLTAAVDAARLGASAPLGADFLRAAAPGYCTSQQQAEAPENWFEQALAYATGKLHGATSALSPTGTGMGQVAGYTPADYLIQHATRERRSVHVPPSTWDAVLSHISDPADAARLAYSASNRLMYRYAIVLYRRAADADDRVAAKPLAGLLARRGDVDELRARADAGDWHAADRLADLLKERGDLDGAERVLRAQAEAGYEYAADRLAELLKERGDLDGAERVLRAQAEAGYEYAADRLAELLKERGDLDGAAQVLRARADAGDWHAADRLAELLKERGDVDELRARAAAGHEYAAWRLADLLKERGDVDELRARADAGHESAAAELAELLAERGDVDELRARAAAGDWHAELAELLADDVDELLADDVDEAEQVLRAQADARDEATADDRHAWLAELLARRGDVDGAEQVLRARADAGDPDSAAELAELLAERGDVDELRARTAAGDQYAASLVAHLLPNLLIKQGRGEEAERFRRFGLNPDGSIAFA